MERVIVFYGAVGEKGRRKVSDVLAFLREIFYNFSFLLNLSNMKPSEL